MFAPVRMISPVEMDYAFVFAAWRDKDDHVKMDQWKRLGVQTTQNHSIYFTFFIAEFIIARFIVPQIPPNSSPILDF